MERRAKVILAWASWQTDGSRHNRVHGKLAHATRGNVQVTADGFKPYQHAIVLGLGAQYVDFAQLVKHYSAGSDPDTRYSPAECIGQGKSRSTGTLI
jgi:hypothetical protein